MEYILVSACLLGARCRYDGAEKADDRVTALLDRKEVVLIPMCPEQLGGMATPREPSERRDGGVWNQKGEDVTWYYRRGAEEALKLARLYGCRCAILKERSPSCGCGQIYDGTFTRTLIPGDGITAELFREQGIRVYGESSL